MSRSIYRGNEERVFDEQSTQLIKSCWRAVRIFIVAHLFPSFKPYVHIRFIERFVCHFQQRLHDSLGTRTGAEWNVWRRCCKLPPVTLDHSNRRSVALRGINIFHWSMWQHAKSRVRISGNLHPIDIRGRGWSPVAKEDLKLVARLLVERIISK